LEHNTLRALKGRKRRPAGKCADQVLDGPASRGKGLQG